jgi:hypothetical protein
MSGAAELPIHQQLFGYCECGHSAEAHGSNGFICAGCSCKKFKAVERKETI